MKTNSEINNETLMNDINNEIKQLPLQASISKEHEQKYRLYIDHCIQFLYNHGWITRDQYYQQLGKLYPNK